MDLARYAAHPALRDFAAIDDGRARLLVRRGYEAWRAELSGERVPEDGARVEGGRGAHPVVELARGERAVVRRYLRGGAVRHLNRARYFLGHRAFAELLATERARAAGVRVPLALAAAERPEGVGYTATFATLWIPGARELARWLGEAEEGARAAALAAAGEQVSLMHRAGIAHPDLNLRNFLVPGDGAGVHLLDFDRARLHDGPVPARRRARDLRRLARSARKLRAPVAAAGWAAFREGYGEGWPGRLVLG